MKREMQETREYTDGEEWTKLGLKKKRTTTTILQARTKRPIVCARRITTNSHIPFAMHTNT